MERLSLMRWEGTKLSMPIGPLRKESRPAMHYGEIVAVATH